MGKETEVSRAGRHRDHGQGDSSDQGQGGINDKGQVDIVISCRQT